MASNNWPCISQGIHFSSRWLFKAFTSTICLQRCPLNRKGPWRITLKLPQKPISSLMSYCTQEGCTWHSERCHKLTVEIKIVEDMHIVAWHFDNPGGYWFWVIYYKSGWWFFRFSVVQRPKKEPQPSRKDSFFSILCKYFQYSRNKAWRGSAGHVNYHNDQHSGAGRSFNCHAHLRRSKPITKW